MDTINIKKWLVIAALLLVIGLILWLSLGKNKEEGKMVQLDMSRGGEVVDQNNSMEPGVPLSGTDEKMEVNASNESEHGIESSITLDLPGGGSREATASEYYQIQSSDIELAFAHVSPGEYSEVYGSVRGYPGTEVEVSLSGPGVMNTATRTVMIGEEGYTRLTWRINQYGTYKAVTSQIGFDEGKTATIEVK